ncbi:mucin-2-like [Ylistrum balloti]|uniref:mucin-2-like n=1 Tax=Ylistrum balloti TaxID=509963 RepID=UPI0029059D3A|nr:mucin-2-like [Ylistrum balloti]
MEQNSQNIEITVLNKTMKYGGDALISELELDDNTETVMAALKDTEAADNPVFKVFFVTYNTDEVIVELRTNTGNTVGESKVRPDQPTGTVTVNFNGTKGHEIVISLKKGDDKQEKMKISKLKIEACFESTACILTIVTSINAKEYVLLTDSDGEYSSPLASGNLAGAARNSDNQVELTLHFQSATLYTLSVTFAELNYTVMYQDKPLMTSTFSSDNTSNDIHFDGKITNMNELVFLISPATDGSEPIFQITKIVGCMEKQEVTTTIGTQITTPVTGETTVTTSSTRRSAPTTTTPAVTTFTTGTLSTSPAITTPCAHTTIEMEQNSQNIEITVLNKTMKYGGDALISELELDDNTETVMAALKDTEAADNPVFKVFFVTYNTDEVIVELRTNTGNTVGESKVRPDQPTGTVTVNFNGTKGHEIVISLKKGDDKQEKMKISKLKIEACFESTACILTIVTSINAKEYVLLTDSDGEYSSPLASGNLAGAARNSDNQVELTLHFQSATLYTLSVTFAELNYTVMYQDKPLMTSTFSSDNTSNDIHFDGKITNMNELVFLISPATDGSEPIFQITKIVGCMEKQEVTTTIGTQITTPVTGETTVTTSSTRRSAPTTTTPAVTTFTTGTLSTSPAITTPCAHTTIEMEQNSQNIEITVLNKTMKYGGDALISELELDDNTETVMAALKDTEAADNPVFKVFFVTYNTDEVIVELRTNTGNTVGESKVRPDQPTGTVTVNFNGTKGHEIVISLKKGDDKQEKMKISKLKIEACFESTACILTIVTSINAKEYVLLTDSDGEYSSPLASGNLAGAARNSDNQVELTLHFQSATLYTLSVTFAELNYTVMYQDKPLMTSTFSSDNTSNDIHFDGKITNMNELVFLISPATDGSEPIFQITKIVGCMEKQEVTTTIGTQITTPVTGETTVTTSSTRRSAPTTTTPAVTTFTTGTLSTSPAITTPCAHTTIEMEQNSQNIEITVLNKTMKYGGDALISELELDDNTETVMAALKDTEAADNPVFKVFFVTYNTDEVIVELRTNTGNTVGESKVRPDQPTGTVTVNFNGTKGHEIVISLKKGDDKQEKMKISKLKIEACFESTACILTIVTSINAKEYVLLTDSDGEYSSPLASGNLAGAARNSDNQVELTLHFQSATLYTLSVTFAELNYTVMYQDKPLMTSTFSSDNTSNDIHFDGKITNMNELVFLISPATDGSEPIFQITKIVGCMEKQEVTTTIGTQITTPVTGETTVTTSSTRRSAPTTTTPAVTTFTTGTLSTSPAITTPCAHTTIEMEQNSQNIEITVLNKTMKYGGDALISELELDDNTETVMAALKDTEAADNPVFKVFFVTYNTDEVIVELRTNTGNTVGESKVRPDQPTGTVTVNFNGTKGHEIVISLKKGDDKQEKMKISKLKIEACFESTACILTIVTSINAKEYVLLTDSDGEYSSPLASGNLAGAARNSDNQVELTLHFQSATLYTLSVTFAELNYTVMYQDKPLMTSTFSSDNTSNDIHFDGKITNMNELVFLISPATDGSEPIFQITKIVGCMEKQEVTTTIGTQITTPVTGETTVTTSSTRRSAPTTTTPAVTTFTTGTITQPTTTATPSTSLLTTTAGTSTTGTVSTTVSLTTKTSMLTSSVITTLTPTIMTSTASTTTVATTTEGLKYCRLDGLSLQAHLGYQNFVSDNDAKFGYIIKDGVQETVSVGDTIMEGEVVHFYCLNCTCAVDQWECSPKTEPCSCSYYSWTEWSQCDKECDTGIRNRTRQLIPGQYDETCDEEVPQTEECYNTPCVSTTTEPAWSPWSICNAGNCTMGTQTRTRCEYPDERCKEEKTCSLNNTNCDCVDGKELKPFCDNACNSTCKAYRSNQCEESEYCGMTCVCKEGTTEHNGQCIEFKNCPCFDDDGTPMIQNTTKIYKDTCEECTCTENGMDCKTQENCCVHNPWSSWSVCFNDKMCGYGKRKRVSDKLYGGPECKQEIQTEDCTMPTPCGQCVYDGKIYNDTDVIEENNELCYKRLCNNGSIQKVDIDGTDGGFDEWTQWGSCSATPMICSGTRERSRQCNNPKPSCGKLCEGPYTETQECESNYCCEITQWSPWTNCSAECNSGFRNRTRSLVKPDDAEYCSKPLTQTEACNIQSCETNCTVSEWNDWSSCSVTCGSGTKSRTREIISDTDVDCPKLNETDDCYLEDCKCDTNEYFTNTSGCEKTCDNRFEKIQCDGPPACECKPNYVRKDGKCVHKDECDYCVFADGTKVKEGEEFENPLNKCERCICEKGEAICSSKCNEPSECMEGEIKVLDEDGCCHVCKKDTCRFHSKTEVVKDFSHPPYRNCTTGTKITYNYCSGGCGDSSHFPNGFGVNECKCCTSEKVRQRLINITCKRLNSDYEDIATTMTISEPTSCHCNVSPCQPPS